MKQMFIVGRGDQEKLQLRQSPDPSPAQGEVRIRVKASGINFADILARQGLYPDAPRIPALSAMKFPVRSMRWAWLGAILDRQGRLCIDAFRRLFRRGGRSRETRFPKAGLALPRTGRGNPS
jgi:hypothetical protein